MDLAMTQITNSTLIINTDTLEYPVSISKIRQDNPNVSFPSLPDEELLTLLGYAVVLPTEPESGDVIEQVEPTLIDGEWYQTWTVREFTADELAMNLNSLKETRLAEFKAFRENAMYKGQPFDFGNNVIEHIQLRTEDRANITGFRVKADAMIAAGRGEELTIFRTYENNNQVITQAKMHDLAEFAHSATLFMYGFFWDFEESVKSAQTIADVPAIPTEMPVFELPEV